MTSDSVCHPRPVVTTPQPLVSSRHVRGPTHCRGLGGKVNGEGMLPPHLTMPHDAASRGNVVTTSTLFGMQTEWVLLMVPPYLSILSSMHGIDFRTSAICHHARVHKSRASGLSFRHHARVHKS